MTTMIEKLLVGLGLESSEYQKGLAEAEGQATKSSSNIVKSLSMIGGGVVLGAMAAAAAGIGLISAAAFKGVNDNLEWGETLDGIGDVLGTSADESAALAVAIKGVNGNVDQITGQMAFMSRGLINAKGEIGPVGEALQDMGIKFQDANGKILPATDILSAVADQLGEMPDGLEKTTLMTRLFGKSGKDLSDVMGTLANGGLAAAEQKAKDLGLAMGEEGVNGAVMFGRKMAEMKMGVQGLFVKLGGALLPSLGKLAEMVTTTFNRPEVQNFFQKIINGVADFAETVALWVPVVITWFQNIFAWFQENPGVIVGILGAMGVAVAVFVYTTVIPAATAMIAALWPIILAFALVAGAIYVLYQAWTMNFGGIQTVLTAFWNNTLKPIFDALVAWLQVHIPVAIQWLSNIWNTVLLPAIMRVSDWIQANLWPLFGQLIAWLQVNIPVALQALSNFWNMILLPAIMAVWSFLSTSVFPLFQALNDFLGAVFSVVIEALAGLWQNVLWPALQKVWSFIQANVLPIFQSLWNMFKSKIMPVITEVGGFIKDTLVAAFAGLRDAIQWVIDKLRSFTDKLQNLHLPSWLTPGSPTPLEIGLRGIGAALDELNNGPISVFARSLQQLRSDGDGLAEALGQNIGLMGTLMTNGAALGEMNMVGNGKAKRAAIKNSRESGDSRTTNDNRRIELHVVTNAPIEPLVSDWATFKAWIE